MAGVNKMSGTVWHVEHLGLAEGDNKRHHSRCIYYTGKKDNKCKYYCESCHGSSHCEPYCEKKKPENVLKAEPETKKATVVIESFDELKYISLQDIYINPKIINSQPNKNKIESLIRYYTEHGELDKPIVVSVGKNKYILEDKYLRYAVAKQLGLTMIPAEMGTKEQLKERDLLRQKGTLIWYKKYDNVGEVIETGLTKATVKFDSGDVVKFDIYNCLKNKSILFI